MDVLNALAVTPNVEYSSSFSSGNSAMGDSSSSTCRQRETCRRNSFSTQRVFTLPNDIRSSCHCEWSVSLFVSDDIGYLRNSMVRCSTEEDTVLS
jgi:hypothetical protein